jgi:transcriptional regulator with XRE-family HTH domain
MPIVKATPQLTKLRNERKLSQEDLAKLAKVNQPFISRFDKAEKYGIDHLISIARALGVTVEDLFIVEEIADEKDGILLVDTGKRD